MQTINSALQTEIDKGLGDPVILVDLYELYASDELPGATGYDPTDAVYKFAGQEITWNSLAYTREVVSRGDIIKSSTEKLNSVSLTFSNISRQLGALALSQQIEGMILVIRIVAPSVTTDSFTYVYRLGKPSDIDKKTFSITATQEMGHINVTVPPFKFESDDPDGRLQSDLLYQGIPFTAIGGSNNFVEVVPSSSFWGRLFGRRTSGPRTRQWSSVDNTPYGSVIPEVFGRCQMQGIHFVWADKGTHVGILSAFCKGPVDAISNIKSRTEGLSDPICSFANPPASAVVHLGDEGGTGTNNGNFCQADLARGLYFSYLAYIEGAAAGIQNGQIVPLGIDQDDTPPVWTAIVRGKKIPLRNSSGVYGAIGWTNNPVDILRFILTDSRWMNIDPAFMEDAAFHRMAQYCDTPLVDESNSQIIVIPSAEEPIAGDTYLRYRSAGLYTPRYFLYNYLGDVTVVPELDDGPYSPIDPGDPIPDPGIPTDPTYLTQKPLIKRFTFNAPITEEMRGADFVNKVLLPAFKGYLKINKYGKYEPAIEVPSDATRLRTATAVGATSIPVWDVTPWKSGPELLKGRILLGFGITTSEVRTPSAAVYSTSGNSITLTSSGSGITATASAATLLGGSTTVQASGTVTISGTPNAGDSATITIDGVAIVYVLDAIDTTGTTAAMLTHYINANQRLNKYIRASWDSSSPTIVTITCLHGALTVPALLKAHTASIANPTSAPTAVGASGGSLPAGTYFLAYSDVNAIGETYLTASASVVVTANQQINVSSLPALVGTSRNFYLSEVAGSEILKFVANRTNNSNFSITDVPEPGAASSPTWNQTAEELIRVAKSFATNSQDVYPEWKASFAVTMSDTYLPTVLNGHKYQVTTAGTTGTTEPTWPTTAGGTVASGTAVFTEIGSTVLAQAGLTRANVIKDSFKWPLGSRQSTVNQIKTAYRSAKDDFALQPLTVNDYVHQAYVKKKYPLDIDLSGVDNFNQAKRLCNFNLSKYREGDHFHALGTGPSGLVLEEGDPICTSDDSGGLINVVTRIEEIRITKDHDVFINQARRYSTQMFSDDVGSHRIPLASTLRFAATKDSLTEFIDSIAIRDRDALVPGLVWVVSHDLAVEGDWRGASLWADFGDGYKFLKKHDVAATLGTCTTTLGSVNDTLVFDETNSVTFTLDYEDGQFGDDMSEAELLANPYRRLFLIENEYVQAGTIVSNGNRSYTASDLLRGRFETDDQVTHSSDERVVYMNGAEVFVEIPVEYVNQEFDYKVVTVNQDVADANPIPFTWIGNNLRPRKVTDIVLVRDASGYWQIQFLGHPRPIEEPATYMVEIWATQERNDPDNLLRRLPVTEGTTHACLLDSSGDTVVEGDEVIYYESTHTDKNNLLPAALNAVSGQTLETLDTTFTRFEFSFRVDNDALANSGDLVVAGLHTDAVFDSSDRTPVKADCPVFIEWSGAGPSNIEEKIYSYGAQVGSTRTFDWDSDGQTTRYSIVLAGTEYRVYANYQPGAGQVPLAIIPAPGSGFPFPLRLKMQIVNDTTTGPFYVDNVVSGGALRPTTIYSEREQIEDFGSAQSFLNLRLYQVSRYPGIGNPVDGSADGQGFHTDIVSPSGHPESMPGFIGYWEAADLTAGSLSSWPSRGSGPTMSAGTAPTVIAADLNGQNVVEFDGNDYLTFTEQTSIRTVYLVVKHNQSTNTHRNRFMPILGHSTLAHWIGEEGAQLVGSSAHANVTGGSAYLNGYPMAIGPLCKAGEYEVYAFVTAGNTTAAQFANDRNAHFFAGRVAAIAIYDQAHSPIQVNDVSNYFIARRALSLPPLVAVDGDSLSADRPTAGSGITAAGDSWTGQMIPALSGGAFGNYDTYNVAIGGQTLAQMQADAATEVDPLFNPDRPRNILVVWGGINDVGVGGGSQSGATTYNRLVTYCQARQAVGWEVVVLSILDRDDLANFPNPAALAACKAQIVIANASIASNWATFADAYIDVQALDYFNNGTGAAGADATPDLLDPNNTIFHHADKIHLNALGQTVIAMAVQEAIEAL